MTGLTTTVESFRTEMNKLKVALSMEPDGQPPRPEVSGGNGATKTDC